MRQIAKNQLKLLSFIERYRSRYGNGPTIREMAIQLNFSDNKSTLEVLDALTKRGLVKREKKKSRSTAITDEGWKILSKDGSILPVSYESQSLADQILRQPSDMARTDTADINVTSLASGQLAYRDLPLKADGTSLDNDVRLIIKTAVSLAIGHCFNGTMSTDEKQNLVEKITNIVFKTFGSEGAIHAICWGLLLIGLTFANIMIIGNGISSLIYSVIEIVVIKKFLIE